MRTAPHPSNEAGRTRPLSHRLRLAVTGSVVTTLAVLGLGMVPAAAVSTDGPVRTESIGAATYEKQVQYWVNVQRRKRGLPALRYGGCPDRTAERWAKHLAASDRFYHQSMQTVLDRCDARYAGETLVKGSISPRYAVRLWMNSPPHRSVLMSNHPRMIGLGSVRNDAGEWVTVANVTLP